MSDINRRFNFIAGDSSALKLTERVNTALRRQSELNDQLFEKNQRISRGVDKLAASYEALVTAEERALARQNSAIIFEPQAPANVAPRGVGSGRRSAIDESSFLGNIGALFGGTQAGQIANTAGDLTRLVEQIPRLDGGLLGLLGTVGPLAIGAGIVAAGFATLTNQLAEGAKEVERNVESLLARRNAEREVRDEMLSTDEVQRRLAAARQREADALADKTFLEGIDDAAFANSVENIGSDLGARIGTALVSLGGGFNSINEAIDATDKELISARAEVSALTDALNTGATAIGDMAAAQETYNDQVAQSGDVLRRLFDQERDLRTARGQLLSDRFVDAEIAASRAKITADNKAADAAEDLLLQQQQAFEIHQDRMAKIQESGAARIESLRKSLTDRETQIAAQIGALTTSVNQERIKAEKEFNRDSARIEREHRIELRRLVEDANANIMDAIRTGDFSAANQIRETRDRDKARRIEDFELERSQRNEDFQLRRAEAEASTQERVAQLQIELAAVRTNTQAKIAEEERLLTETLLAAQADYENGLTLDARRREIQQEREERDRQLREQWAEEDATLRNEREERAFNAQIERIDELEAAEFERIKEARKGLDELQTAQAVVDAQELANQRALQNAVALTQIAIDQLTAPFRKPVPLSAPGGFNNGLLPLPSFDTGSRYIPRDMVAQLHAGERVLTADENRLYSMSQGINGAGNRGAANYLQMSFEGMFNGANIGGRGFEGVEPMIAFAQEQMAIAVRNQIARMTQGRN